MGLMDKYKKQKADGGATATAVAEAPKPAPAPVAEKPKPAPEPTKTVEATVIATEPARNALSLFEFKSDEAEQVLALIVDAAESKPNFNGPFPITAIVRGNNGGMLSPNDGLDAEIAAALPAGKAGFTAVFLGYRLVGLAWPTKMDDTAVGTGGDAKVKPAWNVVVSCEDVQNVALVRKAGDAYQFTPGVDKDKFDGLGHFRPGVEALFYSPKHGLFVVKGVDHASSTSRTLVSLAKALPNGRFAPFPAQVTPKSTDEKGIKPWKCHSLEFAVAVNEAGKEAWTGFQEWVKEAKADAEFMATFNEWKASKISDAAAAALPKIAALGR